MSRKISEEIRTKVRQGAGFLCEYCHTNERWQYVRFTIDHVVPNEDDSIENLALACFHCNRLKSNKTEIFDAKENKTVLLFNPRRQSWKDHFEWSKDGLQIYSQNRHRARHDYGFGTQRGKSFADSGSRCCS